MLPFPDRPMQPVDIYGHLETEDLFRGCVALAPAGTPLLTSPTRTSDFSAIHKKIAICAKFAKVEGAERT